MGSTLSPWLKGSLDAHDQRADGVTITRTLHREDGALDPHRTVTELDRQVRAYQPWPGTWFETPAGRVMVWSARGDRRLPIAEPGTVTRDGVIVSDGVLILDEVQLAGGKRLEWASVLRGHRSVEGSRIPE